MVSRIAGRRLIGLACLLMGSHFTLAAERAQIEARRTAFEVASFKPAAPDTSPTAEAKKMVRDALDYMAPIGVLPIQHGHLSVRGQSLLSLIASAYRVRPNQVSGPSWLANLMFDIEAKLPEGVPNRDANEALQCLLEERLGLRLHEDRKSVTGYALVRETDAVRLKPADPPFSKRLSGESAETANGRSESPADAATRVVAAAPVPAVSGPRGMYLQSTTLARFADILAHQLHAFVEDRTGLSGYYEITFPLRRPESPDDSVDHRVSQALAALGLKLQKTNIDAPLLVIDQISKQPSDNGTP